MVKVWRGKNKVLDARLYGCGPWHHGSYSAIQVSVIPNAAIHIHHCTTSPKHNTIKKYPLELKCANLHRLYQYK